MSRAHLIYGITDENGDLRRYTQVRILNEDGSKFTGKIYRDRVSPQVWSNPFVAAPAMLDIYFDAPVRIKLGITYDTAKPEYSTEVLSVEFDADQTVQAANGLRIEGPQPEGALLCGIDSDSAYWKPLRVDHEHEGVAPGTVLAGPINVKYRQAGGFPETTTLGANSGGWGAASSLRDATMLGSQSNGYGRGTTAVGRDSLAAEAEIAPWTDGTTAIGAQAGAQGAGVAIGVDSDAMAIGNPVQSAVSLGSDAGGAEGSVAIGHYARPSAGGVALGRETGLLSNGPADSIGIGALAQYGLPSDAVSPATMIGASDPSRARSMPWANPKASQSESPWDEYTPEMAFTGKTVQLQRHLTWLADIAGLQVDGDATLGGPEGTLGFYGAESRTKPSVGDDEPGSGITALDNLIYALRDLGLIKFRNEAMMLYRANDLRRRYLDGDQVTDWPDHFGADTASYVRPGVPPTYMAHTPEFSAFPSVVFDNGVYRRSVKPAQELRGKNLLPAAKHYVAVALHRDWTFGFFEGLFNLSTNVVSADNTVLMSTGAISHYWVNDNLARYDRDGLDQTRNLDAELDDEHVYRVTNRNVWPHGRPIIGGPRDQPNAGWDRWSGRVAEIVGLDSTWEESHVQSLVRGLMFIYDIDQSFDALRNPAAALMATLHDPAGGTVVRWTGQNYPDDYLGKVTGIALRIPKPVVYIPFISIYFSFNVWSFRGSLVGNWGNITFSSSYEVQVSVAIGDFDNDGDLDIAAEFDARYESHIGIFSLNNNLTWSMGQLSSNYGHKICRVRHRVTKAVICISGDPPFRYADTEVQISSTKSDGTLLREATTPLWGDGTFSAKVTHTGHKVARVVEKSTGKILGSTEWHENALPRTTVYAADDPDVTTALRDRAYVQPAAVAALAFCEYGGDNNYRAPHVAGTFARIVNDDGSMLEYYSGANPTKATGTVYNRSSAWALLVLLRYQETSGDARYLATARKLGDFLVAERVLNGLVRSAPGSTTASTADNVLAYFALRDLGIRTGTTSYRDAAEALKAALLAQNWLPAGRWAQAQNDDRESLWATALGGLFLLAIGDRAKARQTIRSLKRFRVKDRTISASHYAGPGGLIGYKPYADAGTTPYVTPPEVVDASGTWLALLFKTRYGEPIGDDVASMLRWKSTSITSDPDRALYGAQFLNYSASATSAPYGWRARPNAEAAAWGYLLSETGARDLFLADPLPAPTTSALAVTATRDAASGRLLFSYTWAGAGDITAYEAVPEQSINAGQTWSPVGVGTVSGPIESVRVAPGVPTFAAGWSVPIPDNASTLYRVRVRLRNAAFGGWATSATVPVPS